MHARRTIRNTQYRRRHEGLSPFELHSIAEGLSLLLRLLQAAVLLPAGFIKNAAIVCATAILSAIQATAHVAYRQLDLVDARNKNRLISSFTEEECFCSTSGVLVD